MRPLCLLVGVLLALLSRCIGPCTYGPPTVTMITQNNDKVTCLSHVATYTSFNESVCEENNKTVFVVGNQTTQLQAQMHVQNASIYNWDVWVGVVLDANQTALDSTTGQSLMYTNFAPDQPTNSSVDRCVVMNSDSNFKWKASPCSSYTQLRYVLCQLTYDEGNAPPTTSDPLPNDPPTASPTVSATLSDPSAGQAWNTPEQSSSVSTASPTTTTLPSISSIAPVLSPTVMVSTQNVPSTALAEETTTTTAACTVDPVTGTGCYNPSQGCTVICQCSSQVKNNRSLTEILDELRLLLTVDKSALSSVIRQKNSAADNRNTSAVMGCVAIVVLVSVLLTVVFLDLSNFLFRRCGVCGDAKRDYCN